MRLIGGVVDWRLCTTRGAPRNAPAPLLTLPPRITTSRCNPRRCSETLLPLPPPVPRCCFPAAEAAFAAAGTATQCTATCRPCSMRGGGCVCCRRARTRSAVSENLSTCVWSRGAGISGAEREAAHVLQPLIICTAPCTAHHLHRALYRSSSAGAHSPLSTLSSTHCGVSSLAPLAMAARTFDEKKGGRHKRNGEYQCIAHSIALRPSCSRHCSAFTHVHPGSRAHSLAHTHINRHESNKYMQLPNTIPGPLNRCCIAMRPSGASM